MDQNEQPNESAKEPGGEPSAEGAGKKKRRRRRGKKRGPSDGAAQTQGSEQSNDADGADGDDGADDADDERNDARDHNDAQGGSAGEAVGATAEGDPTRKKKRRRKKKKSGDAAAPDATRPQDGRPQDGRQQDGRPQVGRQQEARQPESRPQEARQPEVRQPESRPQEARQPEGRPPEGRPKRGQKQRPEPGSRGSVLQRRLDRIERDEPRSQPDPIEVTAPPPTNVTNVDSYISHLRGWQREVVTTLRALIRNAAPEIEESIKWSQPVYERNGPVCYVKAFSDHVNFGFWRGTELDDPDNLLVGDLMKMRHVRIGHVNELQRDAFEQFVRQAVRLNKDKGDPTQS